MNEKMIKLEELLKDEAKVSKIFSGNAKEVLEQLHNNGIDLTEDELKAIFDGIHEGDSEDDLSAEELDEVAGGCDGCYDFFHKVGKAIDKILVRIFGH